MVKHKKLYRFLKTVFSLALAAALSLSTAVPAKAAALGIDVSKYQGAINWGAVPSSGVSYAFIKVGSTKSGIDPAFAANVAGAQAAGIRTGVYIYSYATNVPEAVNEANLVLQWIANSNINFPVAFDIEDKVQSGLDAGTVTAMCNAFCDVIASAGYHPLVYTGANFYRAHMTPDLHYDIWIAQYGGSCSIPGHAIWQASYTGSVAGIPGNVDINYMNKDYHSLIIPVGFAQRGEHTYFYNNYRIQFGWVDFNNARYHMDALGHMNTGWFSDESGTYYLAVDGHALVGQNQIDKDRYYFDELGRIRSGWITIADNQYLYDPGNGCRMITGWYNDETGRHYLLPEDGHLVKGCQTIEKANYYFDENGSMQVGMLKIGDGTFYFDPNTGMQQTGFIGDMENRFYFNTVDGRMVTGLQSIDGQAYYFDATGKMTVGWQNLDGVNFYFDPASGTMLKGLIPGLDGVYGTSPMDGHKLVNEAAIIDNVLRCFDENGRLVVGAPYTIGDAVYLCDADGIATLATP